MTKKLEPQPIIANRHYAQGSTRRKRREALIERRRRGEAAFAKAAWKKGRGRHAKSLLPPPVRWSPFDETGHIRESLITDEGFHLLGALQDDSGDPAPVKQANSKTIIMTEKGIQVRP